MGEGDSQFVDLRAVTIVRGSVPHYNLRGRIDVFTDAINGAVGETSRLERLPFESMPVQNGLGVAGRLTCPLESQFTRSTEGGSVVRRRHRRVFGVLRVLCVDHEGPCASWSVSPDRGLQHRGAAS